MARAMLAQLQNRIKHSESLTAGARAQRDNRSRHRHPRDERIRDRGPNHCAYNIAIISRTQRVRKKKKKKNKR